MSVYLERLCIFIAFFLLPRSLFDSSSTSPELQSIQLTDIILDVSLSGDLICLATCHGVRFLSWDLVMMNKKEYPFHTNCFFSGME